MTMGGTHERAASSMTSGCLETTRARTLRDIHRDDLDRVQAHVSARGRSLQRNLRRTGLQLVIDNDCPAPNESPTGSLGNERCERERVSATRTANKDELIGSHVSDARLDDST